jgi:hypothetical protein
MAAVLADGHVALEQAVELLLGVDGTLEAIVEELAGDGGPGDVGGGARFLDITPDVLGHRGVEPGNNARVHLQPFRIIDHGGRIDGAVDVVDKTELFEGKLEEGSPLAKIPIVRVEGDRDVATDVKEDDGGGRGRHRFGGRGKRVSAGGGDQTGGARHGRRQRKKKEKIEERQNPGVRVMNWEKTLHTSITFRRG